MAQFVDWRSKMKKEEGKRALFVFMNWIQWSPDDFPHFYVIFVAFHDMIICGCCCCSNVLKQSAMADSGHQLINDYKISVCESKPASGSVSVYCVLIYTRGLRKENLNHSSDIFEIKARWWRQRRRKKYGWVHRHTRTNSCQTKFHEDKNSNSIFPSIFTSKLWNSNKNTKQKRN